MANTHLRQTTRAKLLEYCTKKDISSLSDGVDALFSELSAHERENAWLRMIVSQDAEIQGMLEEKIKCYQKRQKTDTTL